MEEQSESRGLQRPPIWYITPLQELCEIAVANDFANRPHLELVPESNRPGVVRRLRTDLPLDVAARAIESDEYWERRAKENWANVLLASHGNSWKQLYFERIVQDTVESGELDMETITLAREFVHGIRLTVQPGKGNVERVVGELDGALSWLKVTYATRGSGMAYDREQFGMDMGDCKAISRAITRAQTLTALDLSMNQIDDARASRLSHALADNLSVISINLSRNRIGDRGAAMLARMVWERGNVKSLDLSENEVRDEGAVSIAGTLEEDNSLEDLKLSLNRIGDAGAAAMLEALKRNYSLKRLNISSNNDAIGTSAVAALTSSLQANATIKSIDLSGNAMGSAAGRKIQEALEGNTCLRNLDARLCELPQQVEEGIAHLVKRNSSRRGIHSAFGRLPPSSPLLASSSS